VNREVLSAVWARELEFSLTEDGKDVGRHEVILCHDFKGLRYRARRAIENLTPRGEKHPEKYGQN
jgi:hypothetical protein